MKSDRIEHHIEQIGAFKEDLTSLENPSENEGSSAQEENAEESEVGNEKEHEENSSFIHHTPLVAYLLEHLNELTEELKVAIQEDARHLGI